ncbi:MAG: HAD-IC family P-type ATPase [bacterium]|nr:HAD-IC family P-type ATPase [bacterium]
MSEWHSLSLGITEKKLATNLARGLSSIQVKERLITYGPNQLPAERVDSWPIIFFRQFQNPLIFVLLITCVILFSLGKKIDAAIIFSVLFFNACIGTIQEGRAQHTLRALRIFVKTNATVLRDGKEVIIPDTELTPGDVILIQEGEKVPADARIIESNGLRVDEAALTGESLPVDKISDSVKEGKVIIPEQTDMLFRGTAIVSGNGKAVIVATGIATEIGKISKKIMTLETEIPLKNEMRKLSRVIIVGAIGVSAALFILGTLLGTPTIELLETVVLLGVSVIPEGLPIVLTLVLANGVWRMAKRNALVKKLQAVEALGQTEIIAVDKTGTLTKNELVVRKAFINNKLFDISGSGYEPTGSIVIQGTTADAKNDEDLRMFATYASLLSNAHVAFLEESKQWHVSGDPTEAAMRVLGQKLNLHREHLDTHSPRISEIPFDFKRKYHAVLTMQKEKHLLLTAGAPEVILERSRHIYINGKKHALTENIRNDIMLRIHTMSGQGYRVLCFSFLEYDTSMRILNDMTISDMTFLGFLCFEDSLREEVLPAVRRAQAAGIHIIMITGDHSLTAQAIGEKAGIFDVGDRVLTGAEIEAMDDEELYDALLHTTICARVTPDHKLRIIEAYKKKGKIIAMTGDGVNDAPALVAANLGIGMGKIGTEVSKEASDIVLLDDNFATIITAIEEGRRIYRTIKKVLLYLLSTNFSEVVTITGAILLGIPLPLVAVQIIWLNFVTDSFLDVALAMEGKDSDLLSKNYPRDMRVLVDPLMLWRIVLMSFPMAMSALYLFIQTYPTDLTKAWTICLTTLAVSQWINAWNCRSETVSLLRMNPFSNMFLVAALATVVVLHLGVVYLPFMNEIFRTAPLTLQDWSAIVGISLTVILVEEIRKAIHRHMIHTSPA